MQINLLTSDNLTEAIRPPKLKSAKYCYLAVFLRSKPLKMVEAAGKRGTKQLITVFADAPEENKELKE